MTDKDFAPEGNMGTEVGVDAVIRTMDTTQESLEKKLPVSSGIKKDIGIPYCPDKRKDCYKQCNSAQMKKCYDGQTL